MNFNVDSDDQPGALMRALTHTNFKNKEYMSSLRKCLSVFCRSGALVEMEFSVNKVYGFHWEHFYPTYSGLNHMIQLYFVYSSNGSTVTELMVPLPPFLSPSVTSMGMRLPQTSPTYLIRFLSLVCLHIW